MRKNELKASNEVIVTDTVIAKLPRNNSSDVCQTVNGKQQPSIDPNPNSVSVMKKGKSWFICPLTKYHIAHIAQDLIEDHEKEKELHHFQKLFSYDSNEILLSSFGAYIMKVFPHLGTVYISTHNISFRSSLAGSRTKCIVPLGKVSKLEKSNGMFNFGLKIHTSDQQEILFEFHSTDSLQKCYEMLQTLTINAIETPIAKFTIDSLTDLPHHETHLKPPVECESNQFTNDCTALTIPAPMRIVCITIGTRGDVQPYIALCLGFMKDHHHCILATHLEFKGWIESFGIEFREIKGNPAELMQLCVDYGMFTPRFIYNATTSVSFI
jgi:sterol 3beta-glucosyltransferase